MWVAASAGSGGGARLTAQEFARGGFFRPPVTGLREAGDLQFLAVRGDEKAGQGRGREIEKRRGCATDQ